MGPGRGVFARLAGLPLPALRRNSANRSGLAIALSRATFGARACRSAPLRVLHEVTVERAELLKSLGHVHRVVERRNTIPILANVLIRAESGTRLQGDRPRSRSDRDHAAEVGPGGATTVPAHMFYEIVRKLPEGAQIVLESSGDRAVLAIRAGRSRFTLQTLPESDFPDLAAGEMTHKFKLAAAISSA